MIDPDLLAILACPVCPDRPPLKLQGDFLVCSSKGHGYRIIDGIPHLLPEDVIEPDELKELMNESESN